MVNSLNVIPAISILIATFLSETEKKNDGGPHMTSDNDTYCKLFSRIFVFTVGKEKQRIKVL